MRNIIILISVLFIISCNNQTTEKSKKEKENSNKKQAASWDKSDSTNYFYDNAETFELKKPEIKVGGEIVNAGNVDFSELELHSVIVKETLLSKNGNKFQGAFRYDGYSLLDILSQRILDKKNKDHFNPIIDLYIEIENNEGEKVVVSWGEVFYPNNLHNIIIATKVMRIVPSKTNELWELPTESRLIIQSDLLTERNISMPANITVKSLNKKYKVEKGKDPMFSATINLINKEDSLLTLTENPEKYQQHTLHTIFYGRGRGIHSTQPFTGIYLKDLLADYFEMNKKNIREGIFCIAADDGYRAAYTFSELMNRNDQSEVLLICNKELTNNGIFRIFPACDFFSDRAVKAVNEIAFTFDN